MHTAFSSVINLHVDTCTGWVTSHHFTVIFIRSVPCHSRECNNVSQMNTLLVNAWLSCWSWVLLEELLHLHCLHVDTCTGWVTSHHFTVIFIRSLPCHSRECNNVSQMNTLLVNAWFMGGTRCIVHMMHGSWEELGV